MNKRPRKQALKAPVGALVRVSWLDADCGPGGWVTPQEALEERPSVIASVGYVVGCRGPYLVIAGDRHEHHVNNVGRIPLTWILTFEVIEATNHG
jgi:hypothetical protein